MPDLDLPHGRISDIRFYGTGAAARPKNSRTVQPSMELCAVAERKWHELPERVFSYGNRDLITAYCVAFATWSKTEEYLADHPSERIEQVFNEKSGTTREYPSAHVKIAEGALRQMQSLAKQLDLS